MTTNTEAVTIQHAATIMADLDLWDDAINALDGALSAAAEARGEISRVSDEQELIQARAVLDTTGSNAEARKAATTLALADDPTYQGLVSVNRAARARLAEAERPIVILKERCRLLRSSAAFALDER